MQNKYFRSASDISKTWVYYVKYCKLLIEDPFYKIVCKIPSKMASTKYKISICGIFKNEAIYLREWLEYHILVGIEHFYLYNNNSEDDYLSVLQPYIDKNIVTLIQWPEIPGQFSAYKHWLKEYKSETTWVSFLDIDEFFCPLYDNNISEWIEQYSNYPVLLIYWTIMGSNGKLQHENEKLVIEQYTSSSPKLNPTGKIFYNTNYPIDQKTLKVSMMHGFNAKKNGISIPPYNTFGHFVKYDINRGSSKKQEIQLNHYINKAFSCFLNKHKRGSGAFGKSWRKFQNLTGVERLCTSKNYTIQRFLLELKLRMNNIDSEKLFK